MYNCKKCNILLNDENWYKSFNKILHFKCKQCAKKESVTRNKTLKCRLESSQKRFELKKKLFNYFGNKCECCGILNIDLLCIDHVLNNGAKQRKELKISAGIHFYTWLIKNINNVNLKEYRLLCCNCNSSLGHNGYCPHKNIKDRNVKKTSNKCVINGVCRICDQILTNENRYKHHAKNNKNICKKCDNYNESCRLFNLKIEMIKNYGGKCNHCGECQPEFLTIDHINNDGVEDRKINRFGSTLYRWIKKNNYPKDNYQILCYNCNWNKEILLRREKFK